MYQALPEELKTQNNWVCTLEGDKRPMQAYTHEPASSTNHRTWADFNTALDSVAQGHYDYLGYVFNDSGMIGIDIDKGYHDDGTPTELLIDIVSKCNSYTERSKSGRGVHIFVRGNLKFDGKNNLNGVEIYKTKRYFITTGNTLKGFKTIQTNQGGIDYVVNKYFNDDRYNLDNYDVARDSKSRLKTSENRIYEYYIAPPNKAFKTIRIKPYYPPIAEGGRHLSLLSIAGKMWQDGFSDEFILKELLWVNENVCSHPLSDSEVTQIVRSIRRYRR